VKIRNVEDSVTVCLRRVHCPVRPGAYFNATRIVLIEPKHLVKCGIQRWDCTELPLEVTSLNGVYPSKFEPRGTFLRAIILWRELGVGRVEWTAVLGIIQVRAVRYVKALLPFPVEQPEAQRGLLPSNFSLEFPQNLK
jgi:hypothetical protein